jgi:hydroxymethylbilane synthase
LKDKVVIGTRGSRLALWQAHFVAEKIQTAFPALCLEIKIIETIGDAILDTALSKIGDKGLFTKQIEDELLEGKIDMASQPARIFAFKYSITASASFCNNLCAIFGSR